MSSADHRDDDLQELFAPLRTAEPSGRSRDGLARAIQQASVRSPQRRWKRRMGPPAGLALGLLAIGAGASMATGILTFGGLNRSTSHDDDSAPLLRGLVGQLIEEQRSVHGSARTGTVSRDGVDVVIALTTGRICIGAPGRHASGNEYYDLRQRGNATRRKMPDLADVPRAADLRRQPTQISCTSARTLSEELPAITGSDERGNWIVVLVPDQVAVVRGTSASGQVTVLEQERNLAVGRAASAFTGVSWATRDGSTQDFTFDGTERDQKRK